MLFCACSSVTYSYRHYKRLYACSLLVYVWLYNMCCCPMPIMCRRSGRDGAQAVCCACACALCWLVLVGILINCILCKVLIMLSWAWRASGAVLCWLQLSEMHNVTFWFGVSVRVRPCSMYGFRHKKSTAFGRACCELHLWLCVLLLIVWYIGDDIAGLTV